MRSEERDELLGRLDERTENIETNVAKIESHQKEQNGRLGALEKWMQRLVGAGVFLGLMSPLIILALRDEIVGLFK